jgi:hypothetical protein
MKTSNYKNKGDFAMLDRAFSLFQIFQFVSKERPRFKCERQHGNKKMTITAFEVCDHFDQSIFLGALTKSHPKNPQSASLPANPKGTIGKILNANFDTFGEADDFGFDRPVVIKTTLYSLLKTCGLSNSSINRNKVVDENQTLDRLSAINCSITIYDDAGNRKRFSQKLISYYVDEATDELYIAINSMLANAFLGGQYTRLSIDDRLNLGNKDAIALLLVSHFSSRININKSHSFNVDNLIKAYVPENYDEMDDLRLRRLRAKFKSSLAKISELEGWNVRLVGSGKKTVAHVNRIKEISV